jgi:hypothetical protein
MASETASNWYKNLSLVVPAPSHPWICRSPEKEYVVISVEEYEQKKYPRLYLKEIISYSATVLHKDFDRHFSGQRLIEDCMSLLDEEEEIFEIRLNEQMLELDLLSKMPGILKAMSDCARHKRLQEKALSIWGMIKWYFWSWFCDPNSQIDKLEKAKGDFFEYFFMFITDKIEIYLKSNINQFESEIEIDFWERSEFIDTTVKVRNWYSKYGPDHYPEVGLSDFAIDFRKKVWRCLQLWETLIKLHKSISMKNSSQIFDK